MYIHVLIFVWTGTCSCFSLTRKELHDVHNLQSQMIARTLGCLPELAGDHPFVFAGAGGSSTFAYARCFFKLGQNRIWPAEYSYLIFLCGKERGRGFLFFRFFS